MYEAPKMVRVELDAIEAIATGGAQPGGGGGFGGMGS